MAMLGHCIWWVLVPCLALCPNWVWGQDCTKTLKDIYPPWDDSPWSCRGRCGASYTGEPCACDLFCRIYGDCCHDLPNVCPRLESGAGHVSDTASGEDASEAASNGVSRSADAVNLRTSPLPEMVQCRDRSRLVSACPDPPLLPTQPTLLYGGREILRGEVEKRCHTAWEDAGDEDVLRIMPVTDAVSGHHFANVYCLLCHGGRLQDVKDWAVGFIWTYFEVAQRSKPQNLRDMLRLSREVRAPIIGLPPPGVTARRCLDDGAIARTTSCSCPVLAEECKNMGSAYVIGNGRLFVNPQCMLCDMLTNGGLFEAIVVPDMELLAYKRNQFQFEVIMRWSSSPEEDGQAGQSLQLKAMNKVSFVWREMDCDSSSYDGGSQNGIPGGSNNQTKLNSEGESGSDSGTGASEHGKENASDVSNTTTSGKDGSCRHIGCLPGKPLVDGVCREDLALIFYNLSITFPPESKCSVADSERGVEGKGESPSGEVFSASREGEEGVLSSEEGRESPSTSGEGASPSPEVERDSNPSQLPTHSDGGQEDVPNPEEGDEDLAPSGKGERRVSTSGGGEEGLADPGQGDKTLATSGAEEVGFSASEEGEGLSFSGKGVEGHGGLTSPLAFLSLPGDLLETQMGDSLRNDFLNAGYHINVSEVKVINTQNPCTYNVSYRIIASFGNYAEYQSMYGVEALQIVIDSAFKELQNDWINATYVCGSMTSMVSFNLDYHSINTECSFVKLPGSLKAVYNTHSPQNHTVPGVTTGVLAETRGPSSPGEDLESSDVKDTGSGENGQAKGEAVGAHIDSLVLKGALFVVYMELWSA